VAGFDEFQEYRARKESFEAEYGEKLAANRFYRENKRKKPTLDDEAAKVVLSI
jgi:hypothetical protein